MKRGIVIGKINGVFQEFHFVHHGTNCLLMQKYCTTFYGCDLWDSYCEEFNSSIPFRIQFNNLDYLH